MIDRSLSEPAGRPAPPVHPDMPAWRANFAHVPTTSFFGPTFTEFHG